MQGCTAVVDGNLMSDWGSSEANAPFEQEGCGHSYKEKKP